MKTNTAAKSMKAVVTAGIGLGLLGLPALASAAPARAHGSGASKMYVEAKICQVSDDPGYADDYYSEPTDGSKSMNTLLREMREIREAEEKANQPVSPSAQRERDMVNDYIYNWNFGYNSGFSGPSSSSMTSPYYNSGGW